MRKYIFPLFTAILVFLTTVYLLNKIEGSPDKITIELEATVPQDDKFIVFYTLKKKEPFAGKQSVIVPVKGSNELQTIKFQVPANKHLYKLRLDVGANKEQGAIDIKSVKFKALKHSIDKAIDTFFIPNEYIKLENGKYITGPLPDGKYDPFFVSHFNVYGLYEELMKPQSIIPNLTQYLIALIFFFAVFLSLSFSKFKIDKVGSIIYIFLFFLILLTPLFAKQFNLETKIAINEKRKLATKPAFAFEKEYPQKFEQYYNDNFGMRSNVINWASKLKISLFKSSPKPKTVQFGTEGFMFLVSGYSIFLSYSNANLFSDQQLEKAFKQKLTLKDTLAERGIQYILGFWPNKHTVYKDNLPFAMKMQIKSEQSFADLAIPYFKERKFNFFDVREDMINAKKEKQLYQKFDTHWNLNGSFEAYRSFCKQTYPELGLTAFNEDDFEITTKEIRKGDLVFMLGMPSNPYYHDELPEYVLKNATKGYKVIEADKSFPERTVITINENCTNKKTALIFRDSYGTDLIPFLSLHFHKVVYIYCSDNIYYKPEVLSKVQPNIVMSFCVERYLPLLLK